ncbi:hypothetical protein MBLNU230_g1361t1 [Neophaeotheca triangularis]
MKIAVTGACGNVGQAVVTQCHNSGHSTVQIDLPGTQPPPQNANLPNSTFKTCDLSNDYEGTRAALETCDAIIHLAAIPNPVGKPDDKTHNVNVCASFNGFRAAAELGITRFCYASSVNAIGLAYSNRPLHFDYFPLDEQSRQRPTDSYALAKMEAEQQAASFVDWFPGMRIACMRFHQVQPLHEVREQHEGDWERNAVKQLFGWVNPMATARACVLSVEKCGEWEGMEVFNVCAPTTTQGRSSRELAEQYYPNAEIRGGFEGNAAFWTSEKAERMLGWKHSETE